MKKWRDRGGNAVLTGDVLGYLVTALHNKQTNTVGLSFCAPNDRLPYNASVSDSLALSRSTDGNLALPFAEHFSIADYIAQAVFFHRPYIPQRVGVRVRELTNQIVSAKPFGTYLKIKAEKAKAKAAAAATPATPEASAPPSGWQASEELAADVAAHGV